MNKFSERGQSIVIVALALILIVGALMMFMAANSRNMYEGANTIGDAVGNSIQDIATIELAMSAHVGQQRALSPNQHSIANHGDDAWRTTDCYNRNGTFHVMKTSFDGIHLLCRDNDNSVRDLIVKQRGNSNEFDLETAFTPKDGTLKQVLDWIGRKTGAGKFKMPDNSVIYVDGVLLP